MKELFEFIDKNNKNLFYLTDKDNISFELLNNFNVTYINDNLDIINELKNKYNNIEFIKGNIFNYNSKELYDVVYSNNYIHKLLTKDQHMLALRMNRLLKVNGELIIEFEGYKSLFIIHNMLERIFNEHGLLYNNDLYLPTIREHANVLEDHGFLIQYAELKNVIIESNLTLSTWVLKNIKKPFEIVPIDLREEILEELEERLNDKVYKNDKLNLDYCFVTFKAIKIK